MRQEFRPGLGSSSRNAARQMLEPAVDVVAEDAHANEDDNRDRRDQQAVLHDILTVFLVKELTNCLHTPEPPNLK